MEEQKKITTLVECEYHGCKKGVKPSKAIHKTIRVNRKNRRMVFCSEQCAIHCQMSAEG